VDYLTVAEAATELGVAPRTILQRIAVGTMQAERVHTRFWLIPRAEVERWKGLGKYQGARPRRRRRLRPLDDGRSGT
jgi:excisionase family DNA binding protein